MGSRAQVYIKGNGVYLYTHWGADELVDVVKTSLESDRGQKRRTDPEYLSRIILEDMIDALSSRGEETGIGIDTKQHTDIQLLVTVTDSDMQIKEL